MIKVVFKEKYGQYGEQTFAYKDFEGVEIDDEVLVDTRYGLALAKVVELNAKDDRFREESLKDVISIVLTAKEKKTREEKEYQRKQEIARIKKEAKRVRMTRELLEYVNGKDRQTIWELTDKELETMYKEVIGVKENNLATDLKITETDVPLYFIYD